MLPHQERVVNEETELNERLNKLVTFLDSDVFKTLETKEQRRLIAQSVFMEGYSSILAERIAAFE